MRRVLRMSIVLGLAVAAFGVAIATAAGLQVDASDRAAATQPGAPTDAFERATATTTATQTVVPTDSHERAQLTQAPTAPVVEGTSWTVHWTDVVLAAAIGVGLVLATVLLVSAIRRYPPRGHPPLAHR